MISIKRLRIAAFRGISDELVLDLSATITLLYAANGTGKSTICEAIEWLLTGQVERLGLGPQFSSDLLSAKFRQKNQALPVVEAELSVGSNSYFVRRTIDGVEVGANRASATSMNPGTYLALLARQAAADDNHPVRAQSLRQTWLRGTRFMSAEALARLIDADPTFLAQRKQIFADVFGIRYLLDAEDHLRKYVELLLPTHNNVSQEIEKHQERVTELEAAALPDALPLTSQSEYNAVRRLLGLDEQAQAVTADDIGALAASQSSRHSDLARRQSALNYARSNWEANKSAQASITAASRDSKALRISLEKAASSLKRNRTNRDRLKKQIDQTKVDLQAIFDAGEIIRARAKDLTVGSTRYIQAFPKYATLISLRSSSPEFMRSPRVLLAANDAVNKLKLALSTYASSKEEVALLETELVALRAAIPPAKELADREQGIQEAQSALLEANERIELLAEPSAELRSAVEAFIEHDHSSSDCPVCGHDWKQHASLRAAIEKAGSLVPRAQAVLVAAKRATEKVFRERSRELAAIRRQIQTVSRLSKRIEAKRKPINQFEAQLRSVSEGQLPSVDLNQSLSATSERLAVAQLTAAFDFELRKLKKLVVADEFDRESISNLSVIVDRHFLGLTRPRELWLNELEQKYAELSRTILGEETAHLQVSTNIGLLEATLFQAGPVVSAFDERWRQLSPDSKATLVKFGQFEREISKGMQRSAEAEDRLKGTIAAFEFEEKQRTLADAKLALKSWRTKGGHISSLLDTAKLGMKTFRETYSKRSQEQLLGMSNVVNPLFSRMHANKIVDTIELGEGDEFLSWLAGAGKETLNPSTDFSHGQRQDLALAIFLCRARDLQGTFFLDEPMTHFDELNRVGLLDVLRGIALESQQQLSLFITTSSRAVVRHLAEKFQRVSVLDAANGGKIPLRIFDLSGNPRAGLTNTQVYPERAVGLPALG